MTTQPTNRKPNESAGKNPGGLLGKGWQNKTTQDFDTIDRWFAPPTQGQASGADMFAAANVDFYRQVPYETMVLGIHTGDDLVVLDIDNWDRVPAALRNELNQVDVPFQSSSTTDLFRGHYLFRPRDGYRYGAGALPPEQGSDESPGEVRHGNSIIVSAPSEHNKSHLGRRYQWQRTGVPPIMSEALAEWAGRAPGSKGSSWQETTWMDNDLVFDAASGDQVDAFMGQCVQAAYPEVAQDHIDYMVKLSDNSLHQAFLGPLVDLMKFAAFGFVSANDAAELAMNTFIDLRSDPARASLGGNVSDRDAAQAEFMDLLQWAVGKTIAQLHVDRDALEYECFDQVRQFYLPNLVVPEAPENLPEPPPPVMRTMTESIFYDGDREPVRSTHAAVAAAMVKHLEWKARFCVDQDVWYVYNEELAMWEGGKDRDHAVTQEIATLLETRIQPVTEVTFGKAIHQATLNKDDREAARLTALVTGMTGASMSDKYSIGNDSWSESMTVRDGIMKALKTERELHVYTKQFDSQRDRMAVANGVLDLSPLAATPPALPVLLEDGPEHLITFRSSTNYDPSAQCPSWVALLESAFDDPAINPFIATWFGLCIDRTKNFGKFLLAYGKSHSGKGLIFGLGSSLIFGNPNNGNSLVAAADKNLIVKSGMDMSAHRRRVIAELRGKTMAYIDESGDGGSVDTDALKSYTGGMPQQSERKFENQVMVDVPPLVVSSNHEWRLGDVDAGTNNRIISLYFAYGHGAGAPPDRPDDPHLALKLADEASGILNWALTGYMYWQQAGRQLAIPASVQAHTETMNAGASEFGAYLDLALDVTGDMNDRVLFKDLWTGWDDASHGYKTTHMSRGQAQMVAPRAVRTMRKSVEEHMASKRNVVITDRTVRVQQIAGVKLSEDGQQFVTGNASWLAALSSTGTT